jgi:hypothetical protein
MEAEAAFGTAERVEPFDLTVPLVTFFDAEFGTGDTGDI